MYSNNPYYYFVARDKHYILRTLPCIEYYSIWYLISVAVLQNIPSKIKSGLVVVALLTRFVLIGTILIDKNNLEYNNKDVTVVTSFPELLMATHIVHVFQMYTVMYKIQQCTKDKNDLKIIQSAISLITRTNFYHEDQLYINEGSKRCSWNPFTPSYNYKGWKFWNNMLNRQESRPDGVHHLLSAKKTQINNTTYIMHVCSTNDFFFT